VSCSVWSNENLRSEGNLIYATAYGADNEPSGILRTGAQQPFGVQGLTAIRNGQLVRLVLGTQNPLWGQPGRFASYMPTYTMPAVNQGGQVQAWETRRRRRMKTRAVAPAAASPQQIKDGLGRLEALAGAVDDLLGVLANGGGEMLLGDLSFIAQEGLPCPSQGTLPGMVCHVAKLVSAGRPVIAKSFGVEMVFDPTVATPSYYRDASGSNRPFDLGDAGTLGAVARRQASGPHSAHPSMPSTRRIQRGPMPYRRGAARGGIVRPASSRPRPSARGRISTAAMGPTGPRARSASTAAGMPLMPRGRGATLPRPRPPGIISPGLLRPSDEFRPRGGMLRPGMPGYPLRPGMPGYGRPIAAGMPGGAGVPGYPYFPPAPTMPYPGQLAPAPLFPFVQPKPSATQIPVPVPPLPPRGPADMERFMRETNAYLQATTNRDVAIAKEIARGAIPVPPGYVPPGYVPPGGVPPGYPPGAVPPYPGAPGAMPPGMPGLPPGAVLPMKKEAAGSGAPMSPTGGGGGGGGGDMPAPAPSPAPSMAPMAQENEEGEMEYFPPGEAPEDEEALITEEAAVQSNEDLFSGWLGYP